MVQKMAFVVFAVGLMAACAGSPGKGEGEACQGADDCAGQLVCQPIQGRTGDFCCPTPSSSSAQSNCHSATNAPAP